MRPIKNLTFIFFFFLIDCDVTVCVSWQLSLKMNGKLENGF